MLTRDSRWCRYATVCQAEPGRNASTSSVSHPVRLLSEIMNLLLYCQLESDDLHGVRFRAAAALPSGKFMPSGKVMPSGKFMPEKIYAQNNTRTAGLAMQHVPAAWVISIVRSSVAAFPCRRVHARDSLCSKEHKDHWFNDPSCS